MVRTILFKILKTFLTPSVFIFFLILLGLIFLLRSKKKRIGKLFLILGLVLYYVFSISPTADLILEPLENKYQPVRREELKEPKTDKIVVLLGTEESSILRLSEAFRIYNFLSDNYIRPKIIVSGVNPFSLMANDAKYYLSERGIISENIILEEESSNTFESAMNIKELFNKEPFFLITSGYHMPRSMEVFQKMGTNPIPAPTDLKIKKDYVFFSFFPYLNNLKKSELAVYEYFGIVFYRAKYY